MAPTVRRIAVSRCLSVAVLFAVRRSAPSANAAIACTGILREPLKPRDWCGRHARQVAGVGGEVLLERLVRVLVQHVPRRRPLRVAGRHRVEQVHPDLPQDVEVARDVIERGHEVLVGDIGDRMLRLAAREHRRHVAAHVEPGPRKVSHRLDDTLRQEHCVPAELPIAALAEGRRERLRGIVVRTRLLIVDLNRTLRCGPPPRIDEPLLGPERHNGFHPRIEIEQLPQGFSSFGVMLSNRPSAFRTRIAASPSLMPSRVNLSNNLKA